MKSELRREKFAPLPTARKTMMFVTIVLTLIGAGLASARGTSRVFYLSVHPRQCLIGSTNQNAKTVLVVLCSNAAHNFEVYAVGRGG